jgi:hypothetical protein
VPPGILADFNATMSCFAHLLKKQTDTMSCFKKKQEIQVSSYKVILAKNRDMESFFYHLINDSNNTITWQIMSIRGILAFLFAILLIKIGGKRIFGKQTSIDIIIGITMGAILGKAVTGSAPFIPGLITCTVMSLMHRLLAIASFYSPLIGKIIKGEENLLVENGILNMTEMKRTNLTEKDILEAMRIQGVDDIKKIKKAFLERSGEISIIQITE